MPQGLFDKPVNNTPWVDPRFKQDQESQTPTLDMILSGVEGFMGLSGERRNIGSPDERASSFGQLASAALPISGGIAAMLRPFMNKGNQITQLGKMNDIRGAGISPSMLPPDLIPMGSEAAFNAPKIIPSTGPAINYGSNAKFPIAGRVDVVKMMNDLGNSRNAAKIQRGEISNR